MNQLNENSNATSQIILPQFGKNIVKLFLASCFDGHIDKVAIVVFDGPALIWCQPSVVAKYFTGAIMSVKNFLQIEDLFFLINICCFFSVDIKQYV